MSDLRGSSGRKKRKNSEARNAKKKRLEFNESEAGEFCKLAENRQKMSAINTALSYINDPRLQVNKQFQTLVSKPLGCENAFAAVRQLDENDEVQPLAVLSRGIVQGLLKYLVSEGEINRNDRLRFFLEVPIWIYTVIKPINIHQI